MKATAAIYRSARGERGPVTPTRRPNKTAKRRVEALEQKSIQGIIIFVIGLMVLTALIVYFAPELLQRVKVRP